MGVATILLVQDDDGLGALIERTLSPEGYQVEHALTVDAALELTRTRDYDLLIVDQLVGEQSGVEFIRSLRGTGREPAVILLSGLIRDADTFFTLKNELGIKRLLHKPVDLDVLLTQVEATMDPDEATHTIDLPLPSPTSSPNHSVAPALEQLRAAFKIGLPKRLAELEQQIAAAQATPFEVARLEDVRRTAHRLHGTSGSFGFTEFGNAAGAIERLCDDFLERECTTPSDLWPDIEQALAWARGTFQETADLPAPVNHQPLVLIAEDDPDLIRLLRGNHQGLIQIKVGSTVEMALEQARAQSPNCAIIDSHLEHRGGGFELARQLRDLPGLQSLPIGFMSADDSLEAQLNGLHAGGSVYLSKPVQTHDVLKGVEQLISASRAAPIKVLVVDDDPEFCALTESILASQGFTAFSLSNAEKVLETIEKMHPDILLVDKEMPNLNGIEVCRLIRADPRKHELPILLVTADTSDKSRLSAFRAGADDYVSKPILAEELIARIKVRVERISFLREQSIRDSLTGLLLRAPLVDALGRAFANALRQEKSVSIALLDLDHFKKVNDSHGHLAGDRLLAQFGALLLRRFRQEDLRCRWGGEEFLIAMPNSTPQLAVSAVERILEELKAMSFESDSGEKFRASFSAGVAAFPQDGTTIEGLVQAADERLYRAKRLGRSRVIN